MDGWVIAAIAAAWVVLAVGVAVVCARALSRADEASEMAALHREVRRFDERAAAVNAPASAAGIASADRRGRAQ